MHDNPFSTTEIASRHDTLRTKLATRKLDAAIFASPENVFYLTGLDHWGYCAPHLLLVPLDGEPVLVTRAAARVADWRRECEVAPACVSAMTKSGGRAPGSGPFIRPGSRLGEEHRTWGEGRFHSGEPAFLELSACVSRYHAPLGRLVHIGSM